MKKINGANNIFNWKISVQNTHMKKKIIKTDKNWRKLKKLGNLRMEKNSGKTIKNRKNDKENEWKIRKLTMKINLKSWKNGLETVENRGKYTKNGNKSTQTDKKIFCSPLPPPIFSLTYSQYATGVIRQFPFHREKLQDSPTFLRKSQVPLGGAVQLQCPEEAMGCWSRVGPTGRLEPVGPGPGLLLSNVIYQDAGEYRCASSRRAEYDRWRSEVNVDVTVFGES